MAHKKINGSEGYYAPKHHVPAEGVLDMDEAHDGGYMTDRGERLEKMGFGTRGTSMGSEGKDDG